MDMVYELYLSKTVTKKGGKKQKEEEAANTEMISRTEENF